MMENMEQLLAGTGTAGQIIKGMAALGLLLIAVGLIGMAVIRVAERVDGRRT